MRRLVVVVALAACDSPSAPAPMRLERAVPEYAPLRGGTQIELIGRGLGADDGDRPRVLVGGRESPLVVAVDDTTLQVVVPPGEQPGDTEVVVFDANGSTSATGILHYSTAPTIDAVSPAKVVYTSAVTTMTVTGSGFRDEGAGTVTVLVDGQPATEVDIVDDTRLTFVVPPGPPLVQPSLEIVDERGHAAKPRAFRYVPSERPGLLLFPASGEVFALFYDPSDHSTIPLPWVAGAATRFTAVVRDEQGEFWAVDRALRFGRIDMRAQRIAEPVQSQALYPTMVQRGATTFAIERNTLAFGRVDLATSAFTRIGETDVPCCGSFGLAGDGNELYMTSRSGAAQIAPIDPQTGAIGTQVPLVANTPFLHVEEMRFLGGTLYASSRDGALVTIDPATGQVTVLPVSIGRFNAMEAFE